MKHYVVIGKNWYAYWYFMYDCSAVAILQPGCIFETIEEAERVFDEALREVDTEEVTLYEIDEDGNERIVKQESLYDKQLYDIVKNENERN